MTAVSSDLASGDMFSAISLSSGGSSSSRDLVSGVVLEAALLWSKDSEPSSGGHEVVIIRVESDAGESPSTTFDFSRFELVIYIIYGKCAAHVTSQRLFISGKSQDRMFNRIP